MYDVICHQKRCTVLSVFCIAENTTIGNVLVWFMMAHAYGFCHPEKQTVGCTFTIFSFSHSILIFGSIELCLKIEKKCHFTKLRAKRAKSLKNVSNCGHSDHFSTFSDQFKFTLHFGTTLA